MEIRTIEIYIKIIYKKKFFIVQIKRINKLLVLGLKYISQKRKSSMLNSQTNVHTSLGVRANFT